MLNQINGCLWNAGGLSIDKLKWLIAISHQFNIDVFFLTEVHNYTNVIYDDSWNLITNNSKHHGTGILHKKHLDVKVRSKSKDSRTMNIKINNLKIVLSYWPASGSRERLTFFNKHLFSFKTADIILGDFNFTVSNTRDRIGVGTNEYINYSNVIKDDEDIALSHINDTNKFFTFRHAGQMNSRIDRVYANHLAAASLNDHVVEVSGKTAHLPVFFKFGNISRMNQALWKMNNRIWSNICFQEKLLEDIPPPHTNELSGSDLDSYINRVRDLIIQQQKLHIKNEKKKIYKAKNLYHQTAPSTKSRKQFDAIFKDIEASRYRKAQILLSKKWDIGTDTASKALTRLLYQYDADILISKIKHPITNFILKSKNDILDAFHAFYEYLYTDISCNTVVRKEFLKSWKVSTLSSEDFSVLSNPISREELDIALKKMKNFKAPGNDGLPAYIFKNLPEKAKDLMVKNYNKLLNGETLPDDWKEGTITTLFKKGDRLDIANRRPITLLNNKYKILSKIITCRINRVIKLFIKKDQIGFIRNRQIFDNILVLNELLQLENKFIISVDFKKAFDSVSHEALFDVLKHVKLPENINNLIMNMITGSTARVKVNSDLTSKFYIRRGVKQGDPLSPLLFDLAIEALANKIRSSCKGTKLGNQQIKILLYADDIILVANSYEEQLHQLEVMKKFQEGFGLEMNMDKSFHVSSHDMDLSIPRSQDKFKYLGFDFNQNGIIQEQSIEIKERFDNAINKWTGITNNIRTKATILNTYALSKIWFYSYILDFSMYADEIHDSMKTFLWTNTFKKVKYRTKFKMKDQRLFASKKNGGLGIPDIKTKFKAQKAWIIDLSINGDTKIGKIWKDLYNLSPTSRYSVNLDKASKVFRDAWDSYSSWIPDSSETNVNDIPILKWGVDTRKPNQRNSPNRICYGDTYSEESSENTEDSEGNFIRIRPKRPKLKRTRVWYNRFSHHDKTERTDRQTKFLQNNIDLIKIFNIILKKVKNLHVSNVMWHFVNGVCYFDRGKVCPRCKGEPSLTHIFFDCPAIKLPIFTFLLLQSIHITWNESVILRLLQNPIRALSVEIITTCMYAIYMKRESELTIKYLFECLQSIMISNWLFALYCPQPCIINRVTLFKSKWNGKFSLKGNIPVLLLPESVK